MHAPLPFPFVPSRHTNNARPTLRAIALGCTVAACAANGSPGRISATSNPAPAPTAGHAKIEPRDHRPSEAAPGLPAARPEPHPRRDATIAPQPLPTSADGPFTAARDAAAQVTPRWRVQFERFTRYIDEVPQWHDDGSVWHEELGWFADGTAAPRPPSANAAAARGVSTASSVSTARGAPVARLTGTQYLITLATPPPATTQLASRAPSAPPAPAHVSNMAALANAAPPQAGRIVRATSSDGTCLVHPSDEGLRVVHTATALPSSKRVGRDHFVRFSDIGDLRIAALAFGPRCESLAIIGFDSFRVAEKPSDAEGYRLGPPVALWTAAAAQTDEETTVIHAAFHPSGSRLAIAGPTLLVMQRLDDSATWTVVNSTTATPIANSSAVDLSPPGAPLVTRPLNAPGFGQLAPTTQLTSTPRVLWQMALPHHPGETLQLTEVPFEDVAEPLARKALHVAMARWFAKWQQGMRPRMSAANRGNGRARAVATSAGGNVRNFTASSTAIQGIDACEYAIDGDQRFRAYTRLVVDTSARRAFVLRGVGNGWTRAFAAHAARLVPQASAFAFTPPQRRNLDCSH